MERKIFLSSTAKDLARCREAAASAIEDLDGYKCIRMEKFGARDWEADAFCRDKVNDCHVFVCILGFLHGSSPPGAVQSYTEREYEAAISANKPRLIFLAEESFQLLASHREPDEKWSKQQAFRARVKAERIVATFASPEDLARLVQQALHNLSPPTESGLGQDVFKLCDRGPQMNQFHSFLSDNLKRFPQLYLTPGEESECHDTFVERLIETKIKPIAVKRWGDQGGTVTFKRPDWVYDGDFLSLQYDLKVNLFTALDEDYCGSDLSPAALCEVGQSLYSALIIIQHRIHAGDWDDAAAELLKWYLSFWGGVGNIPSAPNFLVFLSIIYPEGRSSGSRTSFDKSRVQRELAEIAALEGASYSCLLMKELTCVKLTHVKDWFSRYLCHLYDDPTRQTMSEAVFTSNDGQVLDCLTMKEIQRKLKRLHEETQRRILGARGYSSSREDADEQGFHFPAVRG